MASSTSPLTSSATLKKPSSFTTTTTATNKASRVLSRTPSSWDPEDDKLLRHLKEVQKLGWKEIASNFTNRTPNACQFRWRRLKSGSLKSVYPTAPTTAVTSAGEETRTPTPMMHTPASSVTPPLSHDEKMNSLESAIFSGSSSETSADSSPKTSPSPPAFKTEPNWSHFKGNHRVPSKTTGSTAVEQNEDDDESFSSDSDTEITKKLNSQHRPNHQYHWTRDEDELLSSIRRRRSLSFTELSILLPARSENEIRFRIDQLNIKSRSNSIIIDPSQRPRSNSIIIEPHLLTKSASISTASTTSIRTKRNSMSKQINPYSLPLKSRSYSIASSTSARPKLFNTPSSIYSNASGSSFLNQDFIRSKSFSFNNAVLLPPSSNERNTYRKGSISNINVNLSGSVSSSTAASIHSQRRKNSVFADDEEEALEMDESFS